MKIFHIADLHIGKQLNYYNLKENQEDILNQIIEKMEEYRPDVLLIAGDIFDKSMPSGEAYTLFDNFLNRAASLDPLIQSYHCRKSRFAGSAELCQQLYGKTSDLYIGHAASE